VGAYFNEEFAVNVSDVRDGVCVRVVMVHSLSLVRTIVHERSVLAGAVMGGVRASEYARHVAQRDKLRATVRDFRLLFDKDALSRARLHRDLSSEEDAVALLAPEVRDSCTCVQCANCVVCVHAIVRT
jgi:hypothetical protein